MPNARLTKRRIESLAAPPNCDYFVWDDELRGFGVRVTEHAGTVRRAYVVGYRPPGRRTFRRHTLGAHGTLTLDEARRLARRLLADVLDGEDPAEERRRLRGRRTLSQLGEAYLRDVALRAKPTTAREYARLWKTAVVPTLGAHPVADVTRSDVTRLHRQLHATPYQANRVLALLGAFFRYAEGEGARPPGSSPTRGVRRFPESNRERFLTPAEVAQLGEALATAEATGLPPAPTRRRPLGTRRPKRTSVPGTALRPANPFSVAALRLLLLTGCREREILTLRWDAVDLERGFLRLADTKTGRSVRPLGAAAAELLDALPRVAGSPFVFPGARDGKPLQDVSRLWYAVRLAAGLPDVRLHDLRHSFAAVSASGGDSLLVTRALLGHRHVATTQRYAHLADDPVKAAADRAAGSLAAWLQGRETTVTPIRKGSR